MWGFRSDLYKTQPRQDFFFPLFSGMMSQQNGYVTFNPPFPADGSGGGGARDYNSMRYMNPMMGPAGITGFGFKKRLERIDWKRLASVDVEVLARTLDFTTLQENIMNIAFCSIDAELDSRSIDPNYIKLFRLAQLIIEYLLQSQEYLFGKVQEFGIDLNKEKEEHQTTKKMVVEKLQAELSEAKKELRKRNKIIGIQQQIIHSGNESYNKCTYCAKAFQNSSFLQAHLARRHPESMHVESPPLVAKPSPPPLLVESKHIDEAELAEIRERLRVTEAQLLEERNARNNFSETEKLEKARLEEEFNKQMDLWKAEQIEAHKAEIEKVRMMFMKEMKEMATKQQASEVAMEELRNIRNQGSMLGTLREDADPEGVNKQQEEVNRLKNQFKHQLGKVESTTQRRLSEQERALEEKLEQLTKQHEKEIRKLNEEMERRMRDLEDSLRTEDREVEYKRQENVYNREREIVEDIPVVPAVKITPPPPPPPRDDVNDDQEEEESEEEEEEEEIVEEVEEEEEQHEPVVKPPRKARPVKIYTGAELLQRELRRDPDYLKKVRLNVLQEIELKLQAIGIKPYSSNVNKIQYDNSVAILGKERAAISKKHKRFNVHRIKAKEDVDRAATERAVRDQMLQVGTRPPVSDRAAARTSKSRSGPVASASLTAQGFTPPQPRLTVTSQTKQPAPRASTSKSAPQTKITAQDRLSQPKPAPRTPSPSGRQPRNQSTLNSTEGMTFTETGRTDMSGGPLETNRSSDWDAESRLDEIDAGIHYLAGVDPKHESPPRPRARTPRQKTASVLQADVHRNPDHKDASDDENWNDDISSLAQDELSDLVNSQSASRSKSGNVLKLSQKIDAQLQNRNVKKPAGSVDVMATSLKSSAIGKQPEIRKSDRTEDDDLLTSISSMEEDEKPTPKPRPSAQVRGSAQSLSTNTSVWGSNVKASAGGAQLSRDEDNSWST